MNAWWQGREPRERAMLAVMTIALVGAVVWWLLLAPLVERGQQLRAQRSAAAADVAWMHEAAAQLAAAGPASMAAADGAAGERDPLVAAQRAAGAAEIPATAVRLTTGQDGRLEASFNPVPFPALLRWTEQMTRQTGLQLVAFSARAAAPGTVEANVALMASAAN